MVYLALQLIFGRSVCSPRGTLEHQKRQGPCQSSGTRGVECFPALRLMDTKTWGRKYGSFSYFSYMRLLKVHAIFGAVAVPDLGFGF